MHRLSRLATQDGMGMGASGTVRRPYLPLALPRRQTATITTLLYTHNPQLLGPQSMQARALHATRRQENVVVAGLLVAGTALTLQYGLRVRALTGWLAGWLIVCLCVLIRMGFGGLSGRWTCAGLFG